MTEPQLHEATQRVREIIRSVDAEEIALGDFDIIAAGAIPWRILDDKLQVLLIHRPKYDDWSWPKGKLDPGESIAECAIREVREEIGLRITLGIPLSATAYSVKQKSKVVYYWAAKTDAQTVIDPDGAECDGTQWVSAKKAAELLTNPTDVQPLLDLVKAHKNGTLNTQPVLIIRHAKAKPRGKWTRAEGERPLAATGRRQAQAVSRMLEAWQPAHIASSPWLRCVQTLSPYASLHAMKMKNLRALTEHAATRHPERARRAVQKLFDKYRSQAICTHRPVLPFVLEVLAKNSSPKLAKSLPKDDPYLEPGSLIVAQQVQGANPRIVSFEMHTPFHD
ncbi:NUDIX hydrolase [Glutamicibacter sp. JL.03c]|uniref:NUDIX hydrolase n=1 Tax=Glutamicibacter sp. JL.03c TaxID=2984842 RepID=UPI0021F771E9|nr:NUDIX hydrolase [Glutamicibacter sp. JL.03c]UYQ76625.1 NUDIX hydrolase [Glutamicibacter sp. JL.03c]